MKQIVSFLVLFFMSAKILNAQSVGIGTTNPNMASILDLGPSGKPLILPRLTSPQMDAVTSATQGMLIYNTTQHQLYGYMRFRDPLFTIPINKWQPIATGPQMIAWGVVDSFGTKISGSGNFAITWNTSENLYELTVTSHPYYKDSMLLMINPVGNGSWDQAVSTGEIVDGSSRKASIKFTDVSRITSANWNSTSSRRRSWFHFVLYNLREDPYDHLNP